MVRSPQCIKRSADGSGDLKGACGCGASSLVLKGALCVSLMMRTLVFTVDGMAANEKYEVGDNCVEIFDT